jgi:hypothetical protein
VTELSRVRETVLNRSVNWAELETAAPEVTTPARGLLERWGFVLAGTIRRDGTPRISPIEVHFVGDELVLVMIRGTHKARDVLRDPRIVLNAPVTDAARPGEELKLRGRAVELHDAHARAAVHDAVEARSGWRPRDDWHVFAIDLDDVAHMRWEGSELTMTRWTRAGGVETTRRDVTA